MEKYISNTQSVLSATDQESRIRDTLKLAPVSTPLENTAVLIERIEMISGADYLKRCVSELNSAKDSIVISMGLMVVTRWKIHPVNQLLDALTSAKKRGVRIDMYTSDNKDTADKSNMSSLKLRESSIPVALLSSDKTCHHKVIVVDNKLTIIGSHNWTSPSLTRLQEISVAVFSESFASRTLQAIAMTYT